VCVYVLHGSMCVCAYAIVSECIHTCIFMCLQRCVRVLRVEGYACSFSMCEHMYVHTHIYTCVCECMHVYIHIYIHIDAYMYIYVYIYLHICLDIYIYICTVDLSIHYIAALK